MINKAKLEIGVSQTPGNDGNYIATAWYVNDKLQLSFSESENLPPVINLELDFPATIKIVLSGKSIENKVFSLDVDKVTLYIGNIKFKLTEKQAEDLFNEQMYYSTEQDIEKGIELKFTSADPLQLLLDCSRDDMIQTFLTEEDSPPLLFPLPVDLVFDGLLSSISSKVFV